MSSKVTGNPLLNAVHLIFLSAYCPSPNLKKSNYKRAITDFMMLLHPLTY